jgi:hypothetical protein
MKKINIQIIILLALSVMPVACRKDFDEINKNPFNPTQTSMEALFNGIISSLPLGWNEQFYLNNETLYELPAGGAHRPRLAQHPYRRGRGVEQLFSTLRNIRALEDRFDQYDGQQDELDVVRAQLKILLAYKTFKVTDLFGDMPFFDAGMGGDGSDFLRPEYDSQEEIYRSLLEDLKWAESHLHLEPNTPDGRPYYSFRQFETMLKNDLTLWRRWANSMRLRARHQYWDKEPRAGREIIRDIVDNKLPVVRSERSVCGPRDIIGHYSRWAPLVVLRTQGTAHGYHNVASDVGT